jgi:hypothetical protein
LGLGDPAFDAWQGKEISVFSKISTPGVVVTQPLIK